MSIFKGRNIFILACDSTELLRQSFQQSGIKKSIGFGALPTDLKEVENNKKLSGQDINQDVINLYKEVIVKSISTALCNYLLKHKDFINLYNYLRLLLNKEINDSVLSSKNRILADLIYKMRDEMKVY